MQSPYLELRETEKMGRGVFAVQNIAAGTVLVQVHKSRFITYSLLAEHPFLEVLMNRTEHKIVEFAYFLAYCQHDKEGETASSFLRHYLSQLPDAYNNLVCWSEDQLARLANHQLAARIQARRNEYLAAFSQISCFLERKTRETAAPRQPEKGAESKGRGYRPGSRTLGSNESSLRERQRAVIQRVSFEDVVRFIAVVESRKAYFVDCYDAKSLVGALVPELQLFNHSQYSKCRVALAQDSYIVTTAAFIAKDEQVFVDYGLYDADSYLEFYGMIPKEQAQELCAQEKENFSMRSKQKANEQKREREVLIERYNSLVQAQPEPLKHELALSNRPALLEKNQ